MYSEQERGLETALSSLSTPLTRDRVLTVQRIIELANKVHFLYVTRNPAERGELFKLLAHSLLHFRPATRLGFVGRGIFLAIWSKRAAGNDL